MTCYQYEACFIRKPGGEMLLPWLWDSEKSFSNKNLLLIFNSYMWIFDMLFGCSLRMASSGIFSFAITMSLNPYPYNVNISYSSMR